MGRSWRRCGRMTSYRPLQIRLDMYASVTNNRVAEATTEEIFGSPCRPHGIAELGAILGDWSRRLLGQRRPGAGQYRRPGLVVFVGFSRYCWTRSTIGMMAGGCASSMPSSSMTGPRYVRNSSKASWLSQTSKT
jgi:hypothetical protein